MGKTAEHTTRIRRNENNFDSFVFSPCSSSYSVFLSKVQLICLAPSVKFCLMFESGQCIFVFEVDEMG